jgi:hypothetical protein
LFEAVLSEGRLGLGSQAHSVFYSHWNKSNFAPKTPQFIIEANRGDKLYLCAGNFRTEAARARE